MLGRLAAVVLSLSLGACQPLEPREATADEPDSGGDGWNPVGEAVGCEVTRLPAPVPGWMPWTSCPESANCDELVLPSEIDGRPVLGFSVAKNETPLVLVETGGHVLVLDDSGTLLDGFSFGTCGAASLDARDGKLAVRFQLAGKSPQAILTASIGTGEPHLQTLPFEMFPERAVLGKERWLFHLSAEGYPFTLYSVALEDANDVRTIAAGTPEAFDVGSGFLYLNDDLNDNSTKVYQTDGTSPGAKYFEPDAQGVCSVQRSGDDLVWTTSGRVSKTSFAQPTNETSTLLLEDDAWVGCGIASDGWYLGSTPEQAFLLRLSDGTRFDLGMAFPHLLRITPWRVYGGMSPDAGFGSYVVRSLVMP